MGQVAVFRGPRLWEGALVRKFSSWVLPQIRQALELRLGQPLQQYRDFIDNQMLLLMAQQDRASRIFPHLYLVSKGCRGGRQDPRGCWSEAQTEQGSLVLLSTPQGSEWNAANLEELQRNRWGSEPCRTATLSPLLSASPWGVAWPASEA